MAVRWEFHPISSLSKVANTWDAINTGAGMLPFLESAFLLPLARHFAQGDERIAIAHRGDAPIAATILQRQGIGRWSSWQPSQLPLGPWIVVQGEDNVTLANSLLASLPGLTLGIGITQLDPQVNARPDSDGRVQTLDYIQTGWVDVDHNFEMYWEARGKNLRTNMRKQRSKLEADKVTITFDALTQTADVPAAITEYGRMESASWKAESGTAVHLDNAQGRFYRDMMQNFCSAGRGHIWQLRFDGKVVAMDLCIEANNILVILKTTFDTEHRAVSPAFLMRQDAFRQIFDEARIKRIEFYGRLMEWHTRWTERSRTLYHINIFRWAFIPALRNKLRRHTADTTVATAPSVASTENV